jgi:hypothetical protein
MHFATRSPGPGATVHDRRRKAVDMINAECCVMKCAYPAVLYWSTGDSEAEYADWDVCRTHHARLRSGEDFATHGDLPNSAGRWILMGRDLDIRQTDTMQAALVSFEYTASGKEMEMEVSTGRGNFKVILDQQQAAELGEAVEVMNQGAPIKLSEAV